MHRVSDKNTTFIIIYIHNANILNASLFHRDPNGKHIQE